MTQMLFRLASAVMAVLVLAGLTGCSDRKIDEALDTDANGYVCQKCSTKFYTERSIFAGHCPQCKVPNIEQVIGFVCEADKHVTLAGRGRGFHACEQCGKSTSAFSRPRESDLKVWGAAKKNDAEVN